MVNPPSIMLQVLQDLFCVEGRVLEWFESYLCVTVGLTERKPTRSKINNLDLAKSTAVSHRDRCWVHKNSSLTILAELIDEYCLNHHMYADDTQMIEQTIPGNPGTKMRLQSCIEATQECCKLRRLQLNPAKTELIWFGSKAIYRKLPVLTWTCTSELIL